MPLPRLLREYLALRGLRLSQRQVRQLGAEGRRIIDQEAKAMARTISGDTGFSPGPGADPVPPRPESVPWVALVIMALGFGWIGGVIPFALGVALGFALGR